MALLLRCSVLSILNPSLCNYLNKINLLLKTLSTFHHPATSIVFFGLFHLKDWALPFRFHKFLNSFFPSIVVSSNFLFCSLGLYRPKGVNFGSLLISTCSFQFHCYLYNVPSVCSIAFISSFLVVLHIAMRLHMHSFYSLLPNQNPNFTYNMWARLLLLI
jgi:hypothetical protein